MNKNIYKVIGKKIYTKEDGKRYGYIFLAYPLIDGDGFAFTDYSKIYISEKRIDDGIMNQYNINDTVVVSYGWDLEKKKRYIKSATILNIDSLNDEFTDFVPIDGN